MADPPPSSSLIPRATISCYLALSRVIPHYLPLQTTVLRELARLLSAGSSRVVVIVDKSMEIAGTAAVIIWRTCRRRLKLARRDADAHSAAYHPGTGTVPHDAIGNARVLTVEKAEDQAKVMIEAVENQSPDVIIVDELSNKEECHAARTITGRGVAIVATARSAPISRTSSPSPPAIASLPISQVHGDGLATVLSDHERALLLGGVASVTLSAREAEARPDKLRQVRSPPISASTSPASSADLPRRAAAIR